MARQFNYYDDWKSAILRCDRCGWTGIFADGTVEYYEELMDSSCPDCDALSAPMLAIVSYPTDNETRANLEKLSESEKHEFAERKLILAAFESTKLKSENQLPELEGQSIIATWDFLKEQAGHFTVIKCGEREIWRELALYEGATRFEEVVNILKKKYGSRLADVVPTPQSGTYLYGDALGSIGFVKSIRASIRG